MTVDFHTATIALPGPSTAPITGGTLELDESWSPYAQGSVTFPTFYLSVDLDPRDGDQRVQLDITRSFGDFLRVKNLTAATAPGATVASLTAATPGGSKVSWETAASGLPWTPGETRREQTLHANLGLRSRIDNGDGTMTLELTTDELLLQDYRIWGNQNDPSMQIAYFGETTFGQPGTLVELVRQVVTWVLPSATFAPFTVDFDISASYETYPIIGGGYPWKAGTSAFDYLAPYLTMAGFRLWCDLERVWHLDDELTNRPGNIALTPSDNLMQYEDTVTRDGTDWYNAVVITYTWNDPVTGDGLYKTDVAPTAGSWPTPAKVFTLEYDGVVAPAAGAAAKMLNRIQRRGRDVPAHSVSDYRVAPGIAAAIAPPDVTLYTGTIRSVSFDLATNEMDITVRDSEV